MRGERQVIMKILIVIDEYLNNSNGMCISTQRFVSLFREAGHDVRIVATASKEDADKLDYPVREFIIPIFQKIIRKEGFRLAFPDLRVLKKAVKWADIVHIEDPFLLCYEAAKLARKMKKPCTGTFHIHPENLSYPVKFGRFKLANFLLLQAFKATYDQCDTIQCPTDMVRERLANEGFKSELVVVSNGIKGDGKEVVKRKKPKDLHDKFVIISTGRYSDEKDQKSLLKALQLSKHKDDIQVILAGKGQLENELREEGNKLKNKPIMKFMSQDELKKTLSYCDLYVHCAKVEIEGMSCMEAFAAGVVPVIAAAPLSSTSSYALDQNNRFDAGNLQELADKIDFWFEHPDKLAESRRNYIALGKSLTVENSSMDVIKMFEETALKVQQRIREERNKDSIIVLQ